MKYRFWGILGAIVLFSGCESQKPAVTVETYEILGEAFNTFRFFISKDMVLTEITQQDISSDPRKTRVIKTTRSSEIRLNQSTTGRVQGEASSERLLISFEELKGGKKPSIAFVQKPYDGRSDGKYYLEYTVDDKHFYDGQGNPQIRTLIDYDGSTYFVDFGAKDGTILLKDEPYLLYDEDIKSKNQSRTMKGIK